MGYKKLNKCVEVFEYSKPPFLLSPEQLEKELSTSMENGLQMKDVEERLLKYGNNSIDNNDGVSIIAVLVRQAANAMTLVRIWIIVFSSYIFVIGPCCCNDCIFGN